LQLYVLVEQTLTSETAITWYWYTV